MTLSVGVSVVVSAGLLVTAELLPVASEAVLRIPPRVTLFSFSFGIEKHPAVLALEAGWMKVFAKGS